MKKIVQFFVFYRKYLFVGNKKDRSMVHPSEHVLLRLNKQKKTCFYSIIDKDFFVLLY